MIDLGEALASPFDRRRAIFAGVAVLAPVGLVAPIVGRPAGTSYPLLAIVVSLAIAMMAMSAVLLWTQARVARSIPLVVLASLYAATALVMTPYLLLYRGLWPALLAALSADAQTSGWLWLEWHLLFAASPAIYIVARHRAGRCTDIAFRHFERRLAIALATFVFATVAPSIWIDGLPPLFLHGSWTLLAAVASATVIAVGFASIAALYAVNRFRSVLDLWLGVATFCLIADVTVSRFGNTIFTAGWYLSRGYVLVASGTLLIILIGQTASIYEQLARTTIRLRDESLTDALTGLANRRSFDMRLSQAIADCARAGRPAALLLIDVDNFKAFNDAFGHQAGDACLRALADSIRTSVPRASDLVARFGGEEMAVVMAETELGGAAVVAERIRAAVQRLAIRHAPGAMHEMVTVSIGIAAADNVADVTADMLLLEADRALYRAKSAGRNRATVASLVLAGA